MDKITLWAAGFMDGEGTITIKRAKNKSLRRRINFTPYVSCSQTIKGKKAIYKLQELFGGSVSQWKPTGNRLETISWAVVNQQALNFVKKLLPYLILKDKQAQLIIDFYNLKREKFRITDEEFAEREKIFWQMRKLNVKGKLRWKRLNEETPKGEATV